MIAVLAVISLVSGAPQSTSPADSLEQERVTGALGARLDSQLTRFAEYGFSGTVLVARDRRIVLLKGYGLADVARGVRNSAPTRFEMNSMTKMFTGMSILQLAAAGRLRLNDPVERHLGRFPEAKRDATIEQLATHTSGLVVAGTPLAGDTRETFVQDVKRSPREARAGEQYRYTNAGFSLLAAIIEVAGGQSYESYLRQRVFAPAGMHTATFRDQVPRHDTLFAKGYVGTPAKLEPGPPNPYVWGTRGAGGVWATVGDMYRWLVAVEDGAVLPQSERPLLFAPPQPPAEEAFGWHVSTKTPTAQARIDKGGGSSDFASHLLYYPDERVAIIWATNNLRQRWRRTLNQQLPDVVFGDSTPSLPKVATLADSTLAGHAGRYVAARDTLDLRIGRGYLYAVTNTLKVPTNVMFFPEGDASFTAFDPATGMVTRLQFSPDGTGSAVLVLADGRRIAVRR